MIVNGLRDRSTWEEIPFEVIGEAFGALAIEYLGYPKSSMPLLDV